MPQDITVVEIPFHVLQDAFRRGDISQLNKKVTTTPYAFSLRGCPNRLNYPLNSFLDYKRLFFTEVVHLAMRSCMKTSMPKRLNEQARLLLDFVNLCPMYIPSLMYNELYKLNTSLLSIAMGGGKARQVHNAPSTPSNHMSSPSQLHNRHDYTSDIDGYSLSYSQDLLLECFESGVGRKKTTWIAMLHRLCHHDAIHLALPFIQLSLSDSKLSYYEIIDKHVLHRRDYDGFSLGFNAMTSEKRAPALLQYLIQHGYDIHQPIESYDLPHSLLAITPVYPLRTVFDDHHGDGYGGDPYGIEDNNEQRATIVNGSFIMNEHGGMRASIQYRDTTFHEYASPSSSSSSSVFQPHTPLHICIDSSTSPQPPASLQTPTRAMRSQQQQQQTHSSHPRNSITLHTAASPAPPPPLVPPIPSISSSTAPPPPTAANDGVPVPTTPTKNRITVHRPSRSYGILNNLLDPSLSPSAGPISRTSSGSSHSRNSSLFDRDTTAEDPSTTEHTGGSAHHSSSTSPTSLSMAQSRSQSRSKPLPPPLISSNPVNIANNPSSASSSVPSSVNVNDANGENGNAAIQHSSSTLALQQQFSSHSSSSLAPTTLTNEDSQLCLVPSRSFSSLTRQNPPPPPPPPPGRRGTGSKAPPPIPLTNHTPSTSSILPAPLSQSASTPTTAPPSISPSTPSKPIPPPIPTANLSAANLSYLIAPPPSTPPPPEALAAAAALALSRSSSSSTSAIAPSASGIASKPISKPSPPPIPTISTQTSTTTEDDPEYTDNKNDHDHDHDHDGNNTDRNAYPEIEQSFSSSSTLSRSTSSRKLPPPLPAPPCFPSIQLYDGVGVSSSHSQHLSIDDNDDDDDTDSFFTMALPSRHNNHMYNLHTIAADLPTTGNPLASTNTSNALGNATAAAVAPTVITSTTITTTTPTHLSLDFNPSSPSTPSSNHQQSLMSTPSNNRNRNPSLSSTSVSRHKSSTTHDHPVNTNTLFHCFFEIHPFTANHRYFNPSSSSSSNLSYPSTPVARDRDRGDKEKDRDPVEQYINDQQSQNFRRIQPSVEMVDTLFRVYQGHNLNTLVNHEGLTPWLKWFQYRDIISLFHDHVGDNAGIVQMFLTRGADPNAISHKVTHITRDDYQQQRQLYSSTMKRMSTSRSTISTSSYSHSQNGDPSDGVPSTPVRGEHKTSTTSAHPHLSPRKTPKSTSSTSASTSIRPMEPLSPSSSLSRHQQSTSQLMAPPPQRLSNKQQGFRHRSSVAILPVFPQLMQPMTLGSSMATLSSPIINEEEHSEEESASSSSQSQHEDNHDDKNGEHDDLVKSPSLSTTLPLPCTESHDGHDDDTTTPNDSPKNRNTLANDLLHPQIQQEVYRPPPLMMVCESYGLGSLGTIDQQIVELLVTHKAHVNIKNDECDTPLRIVAKLGHVGCMRILLEHNAVATCDIHYKITQSPLFYAIQHHVDVHCLSLLITNGAFVNQLPPYLYHQQLQLVHATSGGPASTASFNAGSGGIGAALALPPVPSPLFYAVYYYIQRLKHGSSDLSLIIYLLQRGALINERDDDGEHVLMKAVRVRRNHKLVELLLDRGANIHFVNKYKKSVLDLCCCEDYKKLIR